MDETVVDGSLFILMNGQPNIVVSPANKAGWREVLIGIHTTFDFKQILSDVETFMVEDLAFRKNNDHRGWRWVNVHNDKDGIGFFTTNIREQNITEEE